MSEIKVNKISPRTACGTTTLGDSGDTFTIPAGVTITNSGTANGFGATGAVNWQTTPKTATFTAASGEGYFINQSSAITMNLPAGSAGAIVAVSDYARNFATYNLTISPNGSEKIGGVAEDLIVNVDGQALTLVYVDSTKGWINVQNAEDTETGTPNEYITATGGSITTVCTNYKVHTFTGPGTFCISAGSGEKSKVDYLVIGGGGGGGGEEGGGGGAGGYRESKTAAVSGCWSASPLVAACGSLGPFNPGPITVTVGGGGNGISCGTTPAQSGIASTFSTITSAGGGRGGDQISPTQSGGPGGSGGGGSGNPGTTGGSGNTPPVSPAQGKDGGDGSARTSGANEAGGGGGGATACGTNASANTGGNGGAGATSSINATPTARAGGGGGGVGQSPGTVGTGGTGGGGTGTNNNTRGSAGTTNTGSGGGGGGGNAGACGGARGGNGGSGLVIIRYRFQ